MIIELDKAVQNYFSGFNLDGTILNAISKTKFRELSDDVQYPSICFERIDKDYDVTRFLNYEQVIPYNSTDPNSTDASTFDKALIFKSPEPFNFMYQIELLAKELYHIDMMELLIESKVSPRGDGIPVTVTDINNPTATKVISYEIRQSDYKKLDDEENNTIYYRRVYTYIIKTVIDFNRLISNVTLATNVDTTIDHINNI